MVTQLDTTKIQLKNRNPPRQHTNKPYNVRIRPFFDHNPVVVFDRVPVYDDDIYVGACRNV